MNRRQLARHAGILRAMMAAGAGLDRVGDSFVRLAEHPDFVRCSHPLRDPALEAHLWRSAAAAGLVDGALAEGPIPLMRHEAGIVHGTLPHTGLLPVIVCWFEPDGDGLFIAADLERGRDYHRLARRPAARRIEPPAPRWRPFGRRPAALGTQTVGAR